MATANFSITSDDYVEIDNLVGTSTVQNKSEEYVSAVIAFTKPSKETLDFFILRPKSIEDYSLKPNEKLFLKSIKKTAEIAIDRPTGNESISLADLFASGLIGLFNRLRTAQSLTLFDNQLQYGNQDIFWDTKIVGANSTVTHDQYNSAADLTVADDGGYIIRQLKEYMRYQSGNAQVIKISYTPDINSSEISFVLRTTSGAFSGSVAGTPFDLVIPQNEWNYDKLDGTGVSGITLDYTKSNIGLMDLEWLGTVRFGFEIDGKFQLCHTIDNANKIRGAYMTTANLPARYAIMREGTNIIQEIGYFDFNNGIFMRYNAIGTTGTLKQICLAIESESGSGEERGVIFSPSTEAIPVVLAAGATISISARHLLTYNGIENRAKFDPRVYSVTTTDEIVWARVVYNAEIVGGTWTQYSENGYDSIMELNDTGTITPNTGLTIDNKYVVATNSGSKDNPNSTRTQISSKLLYGIGIDADTPIPLSLEITNTGTNPTNIFYSLQYVEEK